MRDRKADMIISGGENVYPKEVEDVIYQHPAVKECTVVVSAPDPKWGEAVQAVVVLRPGTQATAEETDEHCKKNSGRLQVSQGGGLLGGHSQDGRRKNREEGCEKEVLGRQRTDDATLKN